MTQQGLMSGKARHFDKQDQKSIGQDWMTGFALTTGPPPAGRILLVENESYLHQLPQPLTDTIAIPGAGLDPGWRAAPWLREREVAYWCDLGHAHASHRARPPATPACVADGQHKVRRACRPGGGEAGARSDGCCRRQAVLFQHLRTLQKGRVEQKFLPTPALA